jgi:ribosomal protein S18 acetylase RimI-like enzyme
MDMHPTLPLGYSPLPPGCVANLMTCLEMLAPPAPRPERPAPPGVGIERWTAPDLGDYRTLFRQIGENWLWTSRLLMTDAGLRGVLHDPRQEIFALTRGGVRIGLLELDFRTDGECELVYFGVAEAAIGQGLGRYLMNHAVARAWAAPIRRLWLHTCTFDHPSAIGFYERSGFRRYAIMVEVHPDPRITGHLPRTAAPHVPLALPPG